MVFVGRLFTGTKRRKISISLESDDGSDLWLNDIKIINNWGNHRKYSVERAVLLRKGIYNFKLRYYDSLGDAFLKLSILLPGNKDSEPIPHDWFKITVKD